MTLNRTLTRTWTRLTAALFILAFAALPASAGRQLSVGAVSGYYGPPGYVAVPVFNPPVGRSWTPPDYSYGRAFREPIYSTPRGYRYTYVRGYYWKRVVTERPYVRRVYRKAAYVKRPHAKRRGPCVTDIGYGRYEYCTSPSF